MSKKFRYHHGSLPAAAIRLGLDKVAKAGPMAVTMRGMARELGVSAAALVHYFHNRSGLRSAIAHAAAEQLKPYTVVRSGGERAGERLRQMAAGEVDFAAKNANLYRLIFGEGWRGTDPTTPVRRQAVYSVDRIANMGRSSGYIRPGDNQEHAWVFHAATHGLAVAAADGALPSHLLKPLLDRLVLDVYNPNPA